MQFYPPGWVKWPAGIGCTATQWCAAMNIDTFSDNANTGDAQQHRVPEHGRYRAGELRVHHQERRRHVPANPLHPEHFTPTSRRTS